MKEERRVTSREVPQILDALCGDDPEAQHDALFRLCPCRNRVYDREVWQEIFRLYAEGPTGTVRDRAAHAIDTLRERLRTDPRSQELIRRLSEEGPLPISLEGQIPVWQPRDTGLKVPRPERAKRSRANRRR